ncbi:ATP/GTP-binding protein [Varibaculum massiliense]|uniref:ATP/GTP-binding protein n=1 Tax=Varibaculum massiliense TaxID=1852372 RepID=UPI000A3E3337|nr:ATP/GTP-binding protein [Varibaculum massiliense]
MARKKRRVKALDKWGAPAARFSGRMMRVPQLPVWRGTSVQVCGLYPFCSGTSAPMIGVPLGLNLRTVSTVCCDPISWFERASLISNPSVFCLANPGTGKSTLIRRMALGLAGQGTVPLVLGDTKPDYVDLVAALDGQVVSVGAGKDLINPLDTGGAMQAARRIGGQEGELLAGEARSRQVQMVCALIELVRRGGIGDRDESILSEALRVFDENNPGKVPVIADVLEVIRAMPPALDDVALSRGDRSRYEEATEALEASLTALTVGRWGQVFGQATTTAMRLDRPVVFDVSDLDRAAQDIQGAVLLTCWSYGFAQVNVAQALANAGLAPRRHYFIVMDELWRILRAGVGMVNRIDELTRLNRARGVGQAMITHTLNDLEALPNPEDVAKAKGFVARSGMVLCGGLSAEETEKVAKVIPLSSQEKAMLVSWQSPPSWQITAGEKQAPPGQGKFLIKVAERPGIPIKVQLTNRELALSDTNKLWANRHEAGSGE